MRPLTVVKFHRHLSTGMTRLRKAHTCLSTLILAMAPTVTRLLTMVALAWATCLLWSTQTEIPIWLDRNTQCTGLTRKDTSGGMEKMETTSGWAPRTCTRRKGDWRPSSESDTMPDKPWQ